ncbi:uncharacterized protein MICPUCDRAFT_21119 [Micromonas pusilla CCMP1545]|uniref:Predicted protein n=1 Tax=Micromonas pusilla (strain CCMP1545) TaxID=564608 RepID=C1N2S5_MICPC|nr:uncharacterized protein MICPUCDRAFT_21119 [Micromonas pusilla CCMP1545]EEH53847.1 predicted protein [Micromonas pusilla CCMP1545]|eukprot:XP_003062135.1 predicted protein [Micromonas pusilla CCMP1545]
MNASCVRPSFVSHSDRGGGARRSSRGEPEPPSPNSRAAKTAAQRDEVRARVRDNILFKDLDAAPLEELVDAAFEVSYPAGAVVIEQGDEGDNFYVVADGVADAAVRGKIAGDAPTTVQVLEPGASFGELSLMYNSPRAATVTARTACRLWALDRETFRDIACVSSQRTRKTREGFLERVPVLSALTAAERSRVADAIETKSFARGDAVVSQGEDGDAFYIVERGQAAAAREGVDARERDVEVKRYVPGDYFGELALLTEKRRAATVRAVSDVLVCAVVSRATFTRLMGSCETIMKRNIESYKEIMMTLGGVGSA